MKRIVEVSSPGKLLLFGEHAVVYGKPCIVTAVDQRMRVSAEFSGNGEFEISAPDVGINNFRLNLSKKENNVPKEVKFVATAVKNFCKKYTVRDGLKISTKSDFSSKFGFGSSSAATVGTIAALSEATGKSMNKREMFDLAYKSVLEVQGVGSGFDLAAAIWGGTLLFYSGGKKIEPLTVSQLPLVVGYTGVKGDTVTLIKAVAEKREANRDVVEGIFDLMGEICSQAKTAIEKKEWDKTGEFMNMNNGLLDGLGVNTIELSELVFAAKQAGAWGAKLSGAGGGDCMICLTDKRAAAEEAIKKAGGIVIRVKTGAEGVRKESI